MPRKRRGCERWRKRGRGRKRRRKGGGKGEMKRGREQEGSKRERKEADPSGHKISYILTAAALSYKGELATSNWKNLLI